MTYDKSTDLFALKVTFQQMNSTTGGIAAWLATFDNIDNAATVRANLVAIVG